VKAPTCNQSCERGPDGDCNLIPAALVRSRLR
jgi:hypothetical protein